MATYRLHANGAFRLQERPIYGSSRVGLYAAKVDLYPAGQIVPMPQVIPVFDGLLRYELNDHLGNVGTVVTGRLLPGDGAPHEAEVIGAQGYEPFGSLLPGRNYSSSNYRFAFQGQEKDDEVHGSTGTSYAYEYRMHDPRIGRFLSIDPLAAKFAYNSPYAFSENRVIDAFELEGLEACDIRMRQQDLAYARGELTIDQLLAQRKAAALGALAGVGILAGGYLAAPYLGLGTATGIAASAESAVLTAPLWAPEAASFTANLFYEGADDAFPTPGPGGELGKLLGAGVRSLLKSPAPKMLLGKGYRLGGYLNEAVNATHMGNWNTPTPIGGGLGNKIIYHMNETLRSGGNLVFDLTGVDVAAAKKGFASFDAAKEAGQITEWELSQVMRNQDYFNAASFHVDGQTTTAAAQGIELIK